MKNLLCIAASAAGLASCASFGTIDDGGRAARDMENAPVTVAAQDDVFGDASVQLASRTFQFGNKNNDTTSTATAERPACDAARHQHIVGTDIAGVDFRGMPRVYRVIPHGVMVSQEYRAERLTISLDENSIVAQVVCG